MHHHFFQRQALGDVVDADHYAASAPAHQRIEGQGVMPGIFTFGPGHPLNLRYPMLLDTFLELWQERLERLEGEKDRLVQSFIQRRA
ncbi:hypothetical protein D3C78_1155730 [compost metagenome]